MHKNPICSIIWSDAAFSYNENIPKEIPNPRLTIGFIVETNNDYTFIATNVDYDKNSGKLAPVDGFIIPDRAIIEFKKIGNMHE